MPQRTVQKKKRLEDKIKGALTARAMERIVLADEDEPFEVLGPHRLKEEPCVIIRAYLPRARAAWILRQDKRAAKNHGVEKKEMTKIHASGLFQAVFEETDAIFPYQIGYEDETGYSESREDPYAFGTEISDYDLYLMGEGTHFRSYEKFGAHLNIFKGIPGVHFAVWAPQARSVSIVGNFNHWLPGAHPMTRIHFSGVWGLFIPRLKTGELYKFAVKSKFDRQDRLKTDPYAFQSELRPHTAAVVADLDTYTWQDQQWMEERPKRNPLETPVFIYELHLGSWRRDEKKAWGFMSYRDLAHEIVEYVKSMGYTHIELLPVMEHPLDESWGYQIINYYAPTSRFGAPGDLMYLIDYCHQNGIGVLLDWVPGHFPVDAHGLADFDGTRLYSYQNWKKGDHREWGTRVFDYGKNEVKNFLISNALFWLEKYHIDGLRVDAVASMLYLDYGRQAGEWEPNLFGGRENLEAVDFIKKFNETVHARFPGILTIAEESTAWPQVSKPTYMGGLGFSMKWNMGWMHDTLEYFSKDPVYRKYLQGMLTFSLWYAFTENFVLPISHDEVVYGKRSLIEKMPGDEWQKFANLRLFFGWMFGHPGKKLLFMGQDFAQRGEWNVKESLDWHLLHYAPHGRTQLFLGDLVKLYRKHPAFYEVDFSAEGFEWIDFTDVDSSVMSFLRWSKERKELLVFTFNMTPLIRENYRIGVPYAGFYREILNSDAREYGGSGMGNYGGCYSENIAWHGRSYSLLLRLPPLAVNIFKLE